MLKVRPHRQRRLADKRCTNVHTGCLRGAAVLHDMAVTVAEAVAGAYLGEASSGAEGAC